MDMQALVDGMSKRWQEERSETQMTLGKLIDRLEEMNPNKSIEGLCEPHSYRGYYSDLAFESTLNSGKVKVSTLLKDCRSAMGEVFTGYKGGDFQMGKLTPIWKAYCGSCGLKIMSLNDDGTFEYAEDED